MPREHAARCLMVGFEGHTVPDHVKRLLAEGLCGVILARRNVVDAEQLRALTDELRAERPEVLISVDQEGGGIGHLTTADAPPAPGAWALGVVDDPALTEQVAGALAGHLAEMGITVSFSPVLDIQREARNPIVRDRAFGADPDLVARHLHAWFAGHERHRIATCGKHFPGHGSTTVDSHETLPVDDRDLAALRAFDLVPFVEAIALGVPMLMTAHVVYRALSEVPATLSRRVLTDLLRGELGYTGVVVTDALEMKAIDGGVGASQGAAVAAAAGADLILIAHSDPGLAASVHSALSTVDGDRLAEAAARVDALAARYATPRPGIPYDHEAGVRAARRAVRARPLPPPVGAAYVLDLHATPRTVLAEGNANLLDALRARQSSTVGLLATAPPPVRQVLAGAHGRPLVLATEDPDLHPWQAEVRDAVRAARPDAVLVSTGLPEPGSALDTYGRGWANMHAAAEALAGTP